MQYNLITSKSKKSVTKLLLPNIILNDVGGKKPNDDDSNAKTQGNISNDVDVEKECNITSPKMNNNNIDVEKVTKTTTPKANNNNICNKLVSGIDIVIKNISMTSTITRDCSLCNIKFETSFTVNKDSSNPLKVFYASCYYISIQNQSSNNKNVDEKETTSDEILNEKKITTPITSPLNKNYTEMKVTKVTKILKDTITYCMSLFDDYITTNSYKFIFLMIRCYCIFINIINNVAIRINEHYKYIYIVC